MDGAQLPFGTWEKVGDLLVVTTLSYVAVVLVCWAWQWVNQRCGIDEETPRMQRWRFAFHPAKGVYGRALGTSHLIIGTAQVVYFVWRTWWAFYNTGTDVLGYCIGAFFAAEMLLHIVVAQPLQKTSTVINLEFFCNVTATVSAFWTPLSRPRQVFALDYFRVITVFWTYETLSYYYLKSKFSDVQQKILHSALSALTLLSFFAFLIMSVENLDDIAWLSPLSEDDEWNAFTAFYFIMVTVSTVGYGDMSAHTVVGRVSVLVMIVVGIVLFGVQTAELMDLIQGETAGTGRYLHREGHDFLLLCGDLSLNTLKEFLHEVYHEDHGNQRRGLKVVVLVGDAFKMEHRDWVTKHVLYKTRVTYLKGEVFNERDLARAYAHEAIACFVVSNRWHNDDSRNVLRVLAFKRLVPGIPVYATLNQAENQKLLQAAGVPAAQVLCVDSITMGLVAQGVITPGAVTLLSNLSISAHHHADHDHRVVSTLPKPWFKASPGKRAFVPRWLVEYLDGKNMEVYEVDVPDAMVGLTLNQVQRDVYEYTGVGTDRERDFHSGVLVLGLAGYPIGPQRPGATLHEELITDLTTERVLRAEDVLLCMAVSMEAATEAVSKRQAGIRERQRRRMRHHTKGRVRRQQIARVRSARLRDTQPNTPKPRLHTRSRSFGGAPRAILPGTGSSDGAIVTPTDVRPSMDDSAVPTSVTAAGGGVVGGTTGMVTSPTSEDETKGEPETAVGVLDDDGCFDTSSLFTNLRTAREFQQDNLHTVRITSQHKRVPYDLQGHIVVTGSAWTTAAYLLAYSLATLPSDISIVFVAPEWEDLDMRRIIFQADLSRRKVYLLKGVPHSLRTLIMARTGHARAVLTLRPTPEKPPVDEADLFFVDKLAVFTTLLVENNFSLDRRSGGLPPVLMLTEFMNDSNVKFLRQTRDIAMADLRAYQLADGDNNDEQKEAEMEQSPEADDEDLSETRTGATAAELKARQKVMVPEAKQESTKRFAQGQLISPSFVTALLAQGFFKPTIIRLMSDLTGGRDKCVRQMKVTNIRCPRRFGAVCAKCHTLDDVCPILDFTGRTYAELVTYACSVLYVTPLGLYRLWQGDFRYVVCNPPRRVELAESDYVYLLSRD